MAGVVKAGEGAANRPSDESERARCRGIRAPTFGRIGLLAGEDSSPARGARIARKASFDTSEGHAQESFAARVSFNRSYYGAIERGERTSRQASHGLGITRRRVPQTSEALTPSRKAEQTIRTAVPAPTHYLNCFTAETSSASLSFSQFQRP